MKAQLQSIIAVYGAMLRDMGRGEHERGIPA